MKKQDKPNNKPSAWLLPCLSVAAVTAFPAVFLYCQNAEETSFFEVAPFLFGSVAVGLVLFACLAVVTKSSGKAALVTSFFMLLMLNFSYVENAMKLVLPNLKYWHTVPVVVVAALHIAWFLWRLMKEETASDASKVLCLVFGGLILLNAVTAVPQIMEHARAIRALQASKNSQTEQRPPSDADMPNVYLLIFDEYANFPEMEEYYNYDNAPLKDFLAEHNFNISYTSHNESILSHTVQTNMASLDYLVNDSTPLSERNLLRHNGALFELMRGHGYSVRILENGDFYGGSMPEGYSSSTSVATTAEGVDMEMLLCQKTILYPMFQKYDAQVIQDYNIISDHLVATAGEVRNTFTLAYFGFPHPPFVVDENGKELGSGAYAGPEVWSNKSFYLGQFKYTTKLMLSILSGIIEQDPRAVIMVMSDHGARGTPGVPYEMKSNSLNALYYQGETQEIEGLSNVNTLRFIMNCLFDLNYEMVPVPN